jgi:hypothetical protein
VRSPLPASPRGPRTKLSEAVPGLIRHLPHHKPWMVAISVIATVVVLTTCGLGSFLLLRDDRKIVTADPSLTATPAMRDINSRTTDGRLMTAADVFPVAQIVADKTIPPYKQIGSVQVNSNCRIAATANVGKLLVSLGCNQVVRATFLSPDNGYYVTAGIFNLKDSTAASSAKDQLGTLLNATNRFTGYVTTTATQVLFRSPTNLAFYTQGHFLIYTVIARGDGKESKPDDPHIKVIVYDLLEKYLRDGVLVRWAIGPTPDASGGSGSSPAAPKS